METQVEETKTEKYGVYLLYDIVPDALFLQLQAIAHDWRREKWSIGDVTNVICQMVAENHDRITNEHVYEFVSIALNRELSARTVRYYAGLSSYFDEATRTKYVDLPYSHFVFARSYGDKALDILALSQTQCDVTGKPPSVEWLQGAIHFVPIQEDGEIIDQGADAVANMGEEPTLSFAHYVGSFCKSLNALSDMLDRVIVEPDWRQNAKNLLAELHYMLDVWLQTEGDK
jgi:hypothetical protein